MFPLTLSWETSGLSLFPSGSDSKCQYILFSRREFQWVRYKRKRTTCTNLEALFTFFSFSNNNIPCGYNEDVFLAPAKLRSSDKCPSCFKG